MKNRILMGIAALMMVAILVGCGKEPVAMVDAAKAAVAAAKTAQADIYLPAEFAALQDSLDVVLTEIESQKSKLFKSFSAPKLKLDQVAAMANEVVTKTGIRKEEVKNADVGLLAELTTVMEENTGLIAKAPKGKEGQAVLEQIRAEMTEIQGSVTEAQTLVEQGAFMDAHNKVTVAREKAEAINTELKEAIAKVKR
ncbi:MAG: hypothetical protein K0B05_07225 [Bacteroidales bacterium]|nr:hypothetical protein [Bacteroidales bacterium]